MMAEVLMEINAVTYKPPLGLIIKESLWTLGLNFLPLHKIKLMLIMLLELWMLFLIQVMGWLKLIVQDKKFF